ncbi:hypothetical protein L9F63_015733 [Diploptera punctata]|uniref:Uncharacterized protein n=1 Tax=Diploptera punctata TaxID=6984 RepID=A0AAD8A4S7_DIPPU|nr:hypothetical protein L9F63_015733 [Diploptera punctata]
MATQQEHHCKDCRIIFNTVDSLSVHLEYHQENLLMKWGQSDETNRRVTTAPADSSEQVQSPSPQQNGANAQMYQSYPNYDTNEHFYVQPQDKYILGIGQDFPSSSTSADNLRPSTPCVVSSPSPSSRSAMYRYHPYQHQQQQYVPDRNNGVTSSRPSPIYQPPATSPSQIYQPPATSPSQIYQPPATSVQCEKCGVICPSSSVLMEHINTSHTMFQNQQIKSEGKAAEILDLDSQKVHQVFQPEEKRVAEANKDVNPHSVSSMLWGHGESRPPHVAEFQQPQAMHYQHYPVQHQVPNSVASSLPQNKNSGSVPQSSGGQTWKSNEPRRPKTFNCSACNKWFTSSGHLKRHYNTTLHKNAVKQSGAPDPATQPISNHHHPGRAMLDMSQNPQQHSPAQMSAAEESRNDDSSSMLHQQAISPPNLMAGPPMTMEAQTGGLQFYTPSSENSMLHNPSSSVRTSPLHDTTLHQHMQPHQQITPQHHYMLEQSTHSLIHHPIPHHTPSTLPLPEMYSPNEQPPHISTMQHQQMLPVSTSNHHMATSGNCGSTEGELSPLHEEQQLLYSMAQSPQRDNQPLPSFAQIGNNPFSVNAGFDRLASSYLVTSQEYIEPNNSVINVGGLMNNNQHQLLVTMKQNDLFNNNNSFWENGFDNQNNFLDDNTNTLSPVSNMSEVISSPVTPECDTLDIKHEVDVPKEMPLKAANLNINNNVSKKKIVVSSTTSNAPHKCIQCDKVFNKACYLTQHNKSFHSGHKPYKCDRCGKRFMSECAHKEHLRKHAGDKPHKCGSCPKQFNHKTDLRRHMCLHTGEKPFKCHICGKGFIRKDHMLKHSETHKKKSSHHTLNISVAAQ